MWPFQTYRTVQIKDLRQSYDYIIIGGGTGGCVVASRLSENPSISVLLIERGPTAFSWASRVPLLSSDFQDRNRSRIYDSAPQKSLNNRTTPILTGSALGGTSRINGLLYSRPRPADLDSWAEQGRKNWGYDDMKQYLFKSEGAIGLGESDDVHNTAGEWKHRTIPSFYFPAAKLAVQSAQELGFPLITDLNSPHQPMHGIAKLSHTIDENSYRSDTASAFLPASLVWKRAGNLDICVNAIATRLSMRSVDDNRLSVDEVYIEATVANGESATIKASKEVILCAGSLGSAQLLLLSGIGPRDHLSSLGIEVHKDLPGVGSNLQDHLGVPLFYHVPLKDSLTSLPKQRTFALRELLRYLLTGTGIFLCPVHETSLFENSELLSQGPSLRHTLKDPDQADQHNSKYLPDIELLPLAAGKVADGDNVHGAFMWYSIPVKPYSRGSVRLQSKDPRAAPIVDLNYLSDPRDRNALHLGLKLCIQLKERMADVHGYPIEDYITPSNTSAEELDKHIEENGVSVFHYTSTCRMAPENDPLPGVVDDELRVHGFNNLRIADASIFPDMLATHPQATIVAVAEKCSDLLKRAT